MDFPSTVLTCTSNGDENPTVVTVHVQSDNQRVDEVALAHHIQEWLIQTGTDFASVTAARHEQIFPVTPLPPLGE
jgi:hypothetical protein